MSINGTDVNYRDWYELSEPAPVLRVEALVDIDERAGTGGGVACGSALGVPRWFIAGVNNADEWFFARQIEGRLQLLDRGLLMLPAEPSTCSGAGGHRVRRGAGRWRRLRGRSAWTGAP